MEELLPSDSKLGLQSIERLGRQGRMIGPGILGIPLRHGRLRLAIRSHVQRQLAAHGPRTLNAALPFAQTSANHGLRRTHT